MKLLKILLLASALATAAFGQGTILFYNHVPSAGINAPVINDNGFGLSGGTYLAQLWAGPPGSGSFLMPVSSPVPFQSGPAVGYWEPTVVVIPNISPGASVNLQVRAWDATTGANFNSAGLRAAGASFAAVTGGDTKGGTQPPSLPGFMTGLTSFTLSIPEPSTNRLAILAGLGITLAGGLSRRRTRLVKRG